MKNMKNLINLSENVIRIRLEENKIGTAVLINYEGKKYWVTAKHFLDNKSRLAEVYYQNKWIQFTIVEVKTHNLFDIMCFAVDSNFPLNSEGLDCCIPNYDCYGNDVFCMGFPYLEKKFSISITGKEIPHIKKGIITAITENSDYLVDKMLESGFSGGPVLMYNEDTYKVIGIISQTALQSLYKKDEDNTYHLAEEHQFYCSAEFSQCVNIINFVTLVAG